MNVLFDAPTLAERIQQLGKQIRADHADDAIIAVCVLKGSVMFAADLIRAIPGDVRFEFLGVSSYSGTESTGEVRITLDLRTSIRGARVLIIEDIVDTGLTLEYLLRALQVREPASLKVASLLDKPSRRRALVAPDYVGFVIEDHFVVGFGLDLDDRFRNLPFVAIYEGDQES